MKRISLTATLAAMLILGVSCQKEGLDGPNAQNAEQVAQEDVFWNIVGELVDRSERTDDYKDKTFKPTIGQPDNGDESIRVEAVNDLGTAVRRYNELVGADITEETAAYTYSNPAVGTLTWNLSTDGKSWATVDVSIPQVPGLQKIIYRSPEQGDVNGSVGDNGSAYYRFGDVIKRRRDDDATVEYWICVRPSFGPEGKGDSHWVSVSPLPMANVWPYYKKEQKPYVASNGFEYGLPYSLGSKLEWHQDLAEMLFAIMYPNRYISNLQNYYTENWLGSPNGLRMFNDFDAQENLMYHNEAFWKNVQAKWKEKGLVQKIFGVTYEEMETALNPDVIGRGLHLLYNGYSWISGNSPKLYEVHYGNSTTDNTKKNMHDETTRTVQSQVVDPKKTKESAINYPLDVYKLNLERAPYLVQQHFFSDSHPRWIVRYATGQELMANKKSYNPQQPISGFETGEEYVYYKDVFANKNLTDSPEITSASATQAATNMGFFYPGVVIEDSDKVKWVCYSGWMDMPAMPATKDHKARFFSKAPLTRYDGAGACFTENLPPEDEAANLVYAIMHSVLNSELTEKDIVYTAALNYLDIDLLKYISIRDTSFVYNSTITNEGRIISTNILYEPAGGRMKGTQPYMRYIYDGSHVGGSRSQLPQELKYPGAHFYTYYNDGRAEAMDLVHLTTMSEYITDQRPIPYDKWSHCRRRDSGIRNEAFTRADRYTMSYIDMTDFSTSPQSYVSAYRDPVMVLRYLELDDDSATFKGTYNGKSYSIVSNPAKKAEDVLLNQLNVYNYFFMVANSPTITWCTLNNQPYSLNLFTEYRR